MTQIFLLYLTLAITLLNTIILVFITIQKTGKKEDKIIKNLEKISMLNEQSAQEARSALTSLRQELINENRQNRIELAGNLSQNIRELNNSLSNSFGDIRKELQALLKTTEERLEKIRSTVDEKLHQTLEERLGQSFQIVSEKLTSVHQGLGEMQSLAAGVGDLKKVLSNVKARGMLGEIQLGNILEQILAPEQYVREYMPSKDSKEKVEFAVRLPGQSESENIFLPLDSKFNLDRYEALIKASEEGETGKIILAEKEFEASLKKAAKEISDKYIRPPQTTDFALMFLPFESLYAEVVKNTSLTGYLRKELNIIVVGPSTLAAFLNSLSMGFRTLAIQKHSSEVWKILGAVKTEFEKFGGILEKVKQKINQAGDDIDNLVGSRTNQIRRKLRNVESLSEKDSILYFPEKEDYLPLAEDDGEEK